MLHMPVAVTWRTSFPTVMRVCGRKMAGLTKCLAPLELIFVGLYRSMCFCCCFGVFCKIKSQILHPKCKILQAEMANFAKILQCFYIALFLSLQFKYSSRTPTKPYLFLIKCRLLKNNVISLMEVDL